MFILRQNDQTQFVRSPPCLLTLHAVVRCLQSIDEWPLWRHWASSRLLLLIASSGCTKPQQRRRFVSELVREAHTRTAFVIADVTSRQRLFQNSTSSYLLQFLGCEPHSACSCYLHMLNGTAHEVCYYISVETGSPAAPASPMLLTTNRRRPRTYSHTYVSNVRKCVSSSWSQLPPALNYLNTDNSCSRCNVEEKLTRPMHLLLNPRLTRPSHSSPNSAKCISHDLCLLSFVSGVTCLSCCDVIVFCRRPLSCCNPDFAK